MRSEDLSVGSNTPSTGARPPTGERAGLAWPEIAAIALAALVLFAYVRWTHQDRPGVLFPEGWYGFHDQGQYLQEAHSLADGDLPPEPGRYTYGLGYPILAAPLLAIGLGTGDPFALADGLMWAASIAMVAILGSRLRGRAFGVTCAAATALATPLLAQTALPWSSTVTVVAVLGTLVVATSSTPAGWRAGAVVGLLAGWCFASRYVDVVWPAIIGGVALARSPRRIVALGAAAASGAAVVALVLASHVAVFGDVLTTPYDSHLAADGSGSSDQELAAYSLRKIPASFAGVFVTARDGGARQPGDPLLRLFPWAVAAPAGVALLLADRHRLRGPLVVAAATSALATAFYLSFRATTASNLKYGNLHYFKAWYPVWALLAAYAGARACDLLGLAARRDARAAEPPPGHQPPHPPPAGVDPAEDR